MLCYDHRILVFRAVCKAEIKLLKKIFLDVAGKNKGTLCAGGNIW